MIPSVSSSQEEILGWILHLSGLDQFDADISFGNGSFYKTLPRPRLCFDIDPQVEGVITACSTKLPVQDDALGSVVFDPPFLTYVRRQREGNGKMVMAKRFGGYWRYEELADHYQATLKECARVLKKKGILVFKAQDIIHNHRMHCTHMNIIEWARPDFRLKDLFVLTAKSRMPIPQQENTRPKQQRHARIHHSYFLVLERL